MTNLSVGTSTSAGYDYSQNINKDNDKTAPAPGTSRDHDASGHAEKPPRSVKREAAVVSSRHQAGEAPPLNIGVPADTHTSLPTLDVLSRTTRSRVGVAGQPVAQSAPRPSGSGGTLGSRDAKALRSTPTEQATQSSDTLPGASTQEFDRLNKDYDTQEGYLPRNSEANAEIAEKIEDGLQQEMTGYPPQVIQFQQRTTHLQGMLADLPDSARQFYGGVIATLGAAYPLETRDDKRYAIDQKLTGLENAVREEASRVRNDPVDRVLSQFNPPMGAAYLNKEDRESVDHLDKLRDDFLGAGNADQREDLFQEASELKEKLQDRIFTEIGKRQRVESAQWKEANGEVDRILSEAQAQTDPAKRYELIGRQLFQITPGQDELKDKVVLAFTQRMHESPDLRDRLDTWHDQVSGPLNAHSVGAAKRYTDILKDLPPVSEDYLRDLSDRYTAVLQDTSYKDYSITPAARSEKLAGQVLEGIDRVLLGLTPLAPLADLLPSTLPNNVRMGLDYGSAFLGVLGGEGWGAVKEISLAGKAISSAARESELASMAGRESGTAGTSLVQTASRAMTDGAQAELALSREAKAAERVLQEKTIAEAGPAIDPTSQLAHQSVGSTPYGSLDTYADPDVALDDLQPGPKPGILVDSRGDRYIGLGGKAYHVRFDSDGDTWRVFKKGADLKPQYPVRLSESTHEWEINSDAGILGGAPRLSNEVKQKVIDLLNQKAMSMRKISKVLGISNRSVQRIATKQKIALPVYDSDGRLIISPETRQKVIDLLKTRNLTRMQVCQRLDIPYSMVERITKENGITSRARLSVRTTPEDRQKALTLLKESNLPRQEIARRLGLSRTTVQLIAEENGIPLSAAESLRNLQITPGMRQEITELLRNTALTTREVSAQTDVSAETVAKIAAQEGLLHRMPKDVTPEQIDQVFALKDQKTLTREIANKVNISESKVKDILANYNANTYKRSWWDTTPEKRSATIKQLDEGKNPKDVARDLDLPLETVRGIANQHRMARDSLANELLAEGKSIDEVAQSLGMSYDYTKGLAQHVPEGTHDIRFTSKDRNAAMDMFEKGYAREDVAAKLGISPWKAHSLANEFRLKTMDSVTPQQLDDIVRALDIQDYSFTTGDLARATHLPETTVAVIEHEYAGGFFMARRQPAQSASSSALSPQPVGYYEWVPPLSPDDEIHAIRAIDEGLSLKDVAGQINQPYAAVARLHEEDSPLVALTDDTADTLPVDQPHRGTTAFSDDDQAEIRKISQGSGLSASFLAGWFDVPVEEIQKVLDATP